MKTRNILIACATIGIVALAWQTSRISAPTSEISNTPLYPTLLEQINDATTIIIESTDDATELRKVDGDWVVANHDNFPAIFSSVKQGILKLSSAVIIEEKTSKPERYAQIGVADIGAAVGSTVAVKIEDASGASLAAVLIGNERSAGQLNERQFYVRKIDSPTALLVEGELKLSEKPSDWMVTDLVNIATDRIKQVVIEPTGEPAIVVSKAQREDNFFSLENIPEGFTAKSRAISSSLGAILLDVKFSAVAAANRITKSAAKTTARVTTFDGLVAHIECFELDEKKYTRLRFEFDPNLFVAMAEKTTPSADDAAVPSDKIATADDKEPAQSVSDEVAELNNRVDGWVYTLPDYKQRMLEKTLSEMIKPIEPEKPAATNE